MKLRLDKFTLAVLAVVGLLLVAAVITVNRSSAPATGDHLQWWFAAVWVVTRQRPGRVPPQPTSPETYFSSSLRHFIAFSSYS